MIYVFADSAPEATRFVADAHLTKERVRMYTTVDAIAGIRFNEEDEVFILAPMNYVLRSQIRIIHDTSWPRPHLYKEVSRGRAEARQ